VGWLQIATVEVPEEHMGAVVELLGKRRGQMFDMQGVGYVNCFPSIFIVIYFTTKVIPLWKHSIVIKKRFLENLHYCYDVLVLWWFFMFCGYVFCIDIDIPVSLSF
jgi:translation elongation factor EF-G